MSLKKVENKIVKVLNNKISLYKKCYMLNSCTKDLISNEVIKLLNELQKEIKKIIKEELNK